MLMLVTTIMLSSVTALPLQLTFSQYGGFVNDEGTFCFDSDLNDGKTAGYVESDEGVFIDGCGGSTGQILTEYQCVAGKAHATSLYCPEGMECQGGRCKESTTPPVYCGKEISSEYTYTCTPSFQGCKSNEDTYNSFDDCMDVGDDSYCLRYPDVAGCDYVEIERTFFKDLVSGTIGTSANGDDAIKDEIARKYKLAGFEGSLLDRNGNQLFPEDLSLMEKLENALMIFVYSILGIIALVMLVLLGIVLFKIFSFIASMKAIRGFFKR
jgi:hypothetical protein